MELLDSRRLTGPNLLLAGPGVVIEAGLSPQAADGFVEAWQSHLADALAALGWSAEAVAVRRHEGGASLAHGAPLDVLYAATEVNEWAFAAAQAALGGAAAPSLHEATDTLRAAIEAERNPRLLAIRDAAVQRGVSFLCDPDVASVGTGTGAMTWPTDDLPDPEQVDWPAVHDVPTALVTGTNGKSTTVRLVASMVQRAGRVPGLCSTDWIRVGDDVLDTGDYSGPEGARSVLRDPRTQVAILETARGGLLRRGLAVPRADAAAVLNVAEDHLGEWGIGDLDGLADTKFLVAQALDAAGRLVLSADEAPVLARGRRSDAARFWFSVRGDHEEVRAHAEQGGDVCFVEDGTIHLQRDGAREVILREADIPITLGGRARFNTSNALAACCIASCVGLSLDAIREGLTAFESSPTENPGRSNLFEIDGVTVFADFAHNPHGMHALWAMADAFPPGRRLVLLGQAGDRTDGDVRALVESTWAGRPDRIIVKTMDLYLRGRAEGEMVALIDSELERLGVPADRIEHAPTELEAVQRALAWAQPGDLLLLLLHAQRGEALSLLDAYRTV